MFWYGHGAWGPHMMGGIGGLGLIIGIGLLKLLLLAGGIALIVVLFRRRGHYQAHTQGPAVHSTALDILDARLARGEINVEEYKEMKRTLLA